MNDVRRKQMRQYAVTPVAMLAVIVGAGVFMPVAAAQDAPDSSIEVTSKKKTKAPPSGNRERPVQPSQTVKTPGAGASGLDSYPVPDWVYDARWYYIDVPRFRNGDKSNDPPGTQEWTTALPRFVRDTPTVGGDLRGIIARIPYLVDLGINAVILDRWESDGSYTGVSVERDIQHLSVALHKAGIRVLLRIRATYKSSHPAQSAFWKLVSSKAQEGVDGFLVHRRWNSRDLYLTIKEKSADNVLIPARQGRFDVATENSDAYYKTWLADPFLMTLLARDDIALVGAGATNVIEVLGAVFPPSPRGREPMHILTTHTPTLNENDIMRRRLVTVMVHFFPGAPLTDYGVEVGIRSQGVPMWWNDLPDAKTKSPDYRGDFFALVQWLHKMRAEHKPLRRGGFRLVLNDAENKIFAFARTLPGDEVILVMNYGDKKQKVMLPAGKSGQMVVAMTPMIDPSKSRLVKMTKGKYDHTKIAPLPVGGGRAFVNKEGKVRLWVAPMSIRVVLVNDKEPRR